MKEPAALAKLSQAERMLAECRSAQDAMQIVSLAEAARVYARQVKLGTQAENHATGIKLKAEIRLAQVVSEGQASGEIAKREDGTAIRDHDRSADKVPTTLDELGVDRQRLAEARALDRAYTPADVDEIVDEANAEDKSVSRRSVIKAATRAGTTPVPRKQAATGAELFEHRHANVAGAVRGIAHSPIPAKDFVLAADDETLRLLPRAQEWIDNAVRSAKRRQAS